MLAILAGLQKEQNVDLRVYPAMHCVATVLLIGSLAAAAQRGVDFSGTWDLESAPTEPDTPRIIIVDQPITRTNVRGEPIPPAFVRITIRRITAGSATTESRHIGVVGGSVGASVGPNRRTHNETLWDENSLVFSDGSYTGDSLRTGEWIERREVWSLSEDRSQLTVEIAIESSGSGSRTEKRVYRRRQPDRRELLRSLHGSLESIALPLPALYSSALYFVTRVEGGRDGQRSMIRLDP
jgi:hypothetical protein